MGIELWTISPRTTGVRGKINPEGFGGHSPLRRFSRRKKCSFLQLFYNSKTDVKKL
jgi:hypothetical protein